MSIMPSDLDRQQDLAPPPVDYVAALRFLDFVFAGITNAFVEFKYFSPGRKPKIVGQSTYLSTPLEHERVKSEALDNRGDQTITVGLAPRCRIPAGRRAGRNQDVLQVGCVWANLDGVRAPGGAIELLRRIQDFPLRPSIVVNSGYGYHVYFVFHAPLRAAELLVWNELIGKLRATLRVSAKADLSEVMRLPGTLNTDEAHPVTCEICEGSSSWTRYSVEEVRRAVDRSATNGSLHTPAGATVNGIDSDDSAVSVEDLRRRGVTADVVEAIITGRAGGISGRGAGGESGRDSRIASILLKKGFSEEEIKTIFRAHPNGCGSNWARLKDGERYLERTVRKAFSEGMAGDVWPEDDEEIMRSALPPDYELKDGAVWLTPPASDTGSKQPRQVKVCNSFIRISEIRENIDTGEFSLSIAFDYLGKTRTIQLSRSGAADSRKLVAALAGAGAPVTSNNARLVTAYLAAYEHAFASAIPQKKVTSRFGRGHRGGHFFLPGLSSEVEFVPSGPGDATLYRAYSSRRGSLGGWLEVMHALADETLIIPQVAILASLVPPLQGRLRLPNFILDLHGNSSTGKSTSLKLAASVYGRVHDPDSLILQWMNTQLAVEQVAGLCNGLPIFLDDAQHCPAELKRSIVYMIANGRGKGRSSQGGGTRETPTWHTVALSTSEEPLHEASPHEGARGRILSIGGMTPPFRPGMAALVLSLERAVASAHGHAGETYIRHLNGWTESDWMRWYRRYCAIRDELARSSSSNLVGRVSGYIAAIQLAAEVACPLLGLRFKPDVIGSWLMLHLDEQQRDQNLVLVALRTLADYYVAHINHFAGDGRYDPGKHLALYGLAERQKYVGFLRSTIENIFRAQKWNTTAMLNKLSEAGALYKTERERHTKKVAVDKVNHRMVCIKWSAILPDDLPLQD